MREAQGNVGEKHRKRHLKLNSLNYPHKKKLYSLWFVSNISKKKIVTLFGLKYKQWLTISIIFDAIIP
jgi:hypothetical protein